MPRSSSARFSSLDLHVEISICGLIDIVSSTAWVQQYASSPIIPIVPDTLSSDAIDAAVALQGQDISSHYASDNRPMMDMPVAPVMSDTDMDR